MRYKTGYDPVENARQNMMYFSEAHPSNVKPVTEVLSAPLTGAGVTAILLSVAEPKSLPEEPTHETENLTIDSDDGDNIDGWDDDGWGHDYGCKICYPDSVDCDECDDLDCTCGNC